MTRKVEEVVKAVKQLPQEQLKQFRAWFQRFDSEAWNEQIEKDIKAGKLDALAQAATADHHAGKSKKLNNKRGQQKRSDPIKIGISVRNP